MAVVIYYCRSDLLSVAFLLWLGPLGFPGRVRVKFAQNEGHEKTTESHEKRSNTVDSKHMRATKKPRKSNE